MLRYLESRCLWFALASGIIQYYKLERARYRPTRAVTPRQARVLLTFAILLWEYISLVPYNRLYVIKPAFIILSLVLRIFESIWPAKLNSINYLDLIRSPANQRTVVS